MQSIMLICVFVGYKSAFKWVDYLRQTKAMAAPVKLFDKVRFVP